LSFFTLIMLYCLFKPAKDKDRRRNNKITRPSDSVEVHRRIAVFGRYITDIRIVGYAEVVEYVLRNAVPHIGDISLVADVFHADLAAPEASGDQAAEMAEENHAAPHFRLSGFGPCDLV